MGSLSKALTWVKHNLKVVLFALFVILISILVISWGKKNKTIRELELQLAITQAKLKIEGLTVRYNTTIEDLHKLKEKDQKIKEEIEKIEQSLQTKLKDDMTAEEIAEKFKEIGILP